jgi:L-fuconate dehydratase
MADFVAITGKMEERAVEFVDHLHEHFIDPVRVRDGRYLVPFAPGFSAEMQPESLKRYHFPDGPAWKAMRPDP